MENAVKGNNITSLPTMDDGQTILAIIARLATDPQADVTKLEKLLDAQERIMNKKAEMAFASSMAELQPLLPTIKHDAKIKHGEKLISTYSTYEAIDSVIKPLYTKYGFAISFNSKRNDDGTMVYYGTVSHKDGHSKTAEMVLPSDSSGAKNSIQALGSTISYAKRYLVGMLLNLVTAGEDDDGDKFGTVDTEKAAEIDLLIRNSGANREQFLKYMGVKDVLSIKASDYKTAIESLNKKAKAKNV